MLALRISSFLSLKPDAVLKHWACAKIVRSKPTATGSGKDAELDGDEAICRSIVDKFEKLGGGGVSYADIAKRAWEVGRADLATKVGLSVASIALIAHDIAPYDSSWTMRHGHQTRSRSCSA